MSERWPSLDQLPTLALGVLAAIVVSASTVASGWVPGLDPIVAVSVVAVVFVGGLAMLPLLSVWVVLGLTVLAAPVAALLAFGGPAVSSGPPGMFRPLDRWLGEVLLGSGLADLSFVHAQIAALFWIASAWFAWCLMRWRQPLLALIPGTAVIATNALNHPDGQDGYIVGYGAVICFLLLWTSYRRSLRAASGRAVRLGADVRVDFWTTGGLLTVAVIVVAALLPPMSNTNRTVAIQNGMFQGWAQLQGRIASLGPFSNGQPLIGFTFNADLGGPLQESETPIFSYSATGDAANPFYFQGVTMTATRNGEWQFESGGADVAQPAGQAVRWRYPTRAQVAETFSVHLFGPVGRDPVLLPFAGQLTAISRPTVLVAPRRPARAQDPAGGILSLDELEAQAASRSAYEFEAGFSVATAQQLREAGTDYPSWLNAYRNFTNSATALPGHWSGGGYRSPAVLNRIHDLAMRVTQGATNPYDEASAIDAYLRDGNVYSYSLDPRTPPQGTDPLAYFLFDSHQGYCQYFASAMGDMLRSLGLPVRLVSGFTGGTYSFADNDYVVRSGDAHMWVQVYFPAYGWINFDPTPSGLDQAPAGGPQPGICPECTGAATPNPHPTSSSPTSHPSSRPGGSGGGSAGGAGSGPPWLAPLVAGIGSAGGTALLLLLFVAWLRPRNLEGVWRRSLRLAGLAGISLGVGDTPGEVGERIATGLPQAAGPARRLAGCMAVAAYAPPGLAAAQVDGAMAAWRELRPHLLRGWLRRVVRRSP